MWNLFGHGIEQQNLGLFSELLIVLQPFLSNVLGNVFDISDWMQRQVALSGCGQPV
jgi:hypothetical protein